MNSSFAKRQLEKHGWTHGDGLGRKRDGMIAPIKVNLKMDKTGVGHDPGKEFTDHWWMRAFNEAAKKVKKSDESQPNKMKEEDEKSKKQTELNKRKNSFYEGFVKASTLTNGCEIKATDHNSSEEEQEEAHQTASVPSLDDLHKFCGGATGHRAAGFGIKMSGKLSRVAAHDKEFEEMARDQPGITYVKKRKHDKSTIDISSSDDLSLTTSKRLKAMNEEELSEQVVEASGKKSKKKKRKNKKEKENEVNEVIEDQKVENVEETEEEKATVVIHNEDLKHESKKNKKKRKREKEDQDKHICFNSSKLIQHEDIDTETKKTPQVKIEPNAVEMITEFENPKERKKERKKKRAEHDSVEQVSKISVNEQREDAQTNVIKDCDVDGVKECEIPRKKKKKSKDATKDYVLSSEESMANSLKCQSSIQNNDIQENDSDKGVRKKKKKKNKD